MIKRIRYWRVYRKMNQAAKRHDWETVLHLARRIGDAECRKLFALARIVQLLNGV